MAVITTGESPQNMAFKAYGSSVPFSKMRAEIDDLLETLNHSQDIDVEFGDGEGHIDVDSTACAKYEARAPEEIAYPTESEAVQLPSEKTSYRSHYVPATDLGEVRIYSANRVRPLSTGAIFTRMFADFGQFCVTLVFITPIRTAVAIGRLFILTRTHAQGSFVGFTPTAAVYKPAKVQTPPRLGPAIRAINITRLVRIGVAIWAATVVTSIALFTNGML